MKRIQLTTGLVALSLFLAACGAGDGDSTTTGSETTTTAAAAGTTTTGAEAAGIVPGEDADVDAIVEVYSVVFDSTTSFEEKSAFIVDASGLEETIATYASTGDSVGGVTAEATAVTIEGKEATVVYTLLFSGNPTYPGQAGSAILVDGTWKVSREMFCGVMASARSACPAG
ncbi:MAG TPA: hypothetical protein VIW94_07330 [Acidimicrobiia bacterium]